MKKKAYSSALAVLNLLVLLRILNHRCTDNLHTAAVKLYVYDKQLITMHEVITAMYTVSCKTWNVEWNGTWNGMWNGTWNGMWNGTWNGT